ncbi:hypothetical protein GW17_00055660 [Ensete ventricosum]|nr:hypothetical protein GW17_00055660 [Ensete ventricosum]
MKIFDWMHRKLHPCSVKYAQVSQKRGTGSGDSPLVLPWDVLGGDEEEKREVLFEGVMEKEALLLHDVLNGILTIGTLGHQDSFVSQPYPAQEDDLLQEEEENVADEVKGSAPAVAAAREPLPAIVVESFKFKLPVEAEVNRMEMAVQDVEEAEKIQELPLLKEDKEKRERGRTTLADLFAADAFVVNDPAENDVKRADDIVKQHANPERKKAQRDKKEEKRTPATTKAITNPNRKLQKLMTKMLKKKIHPEMAAADTQTKERNKEGSDGSGSRIYW